MQLKATVRRDVAPDETGAPKRIELSAIDNPEIAAQLHKIANGQRYDLFGCFDIKIIKVEPVASSKEGQALDMQDADKYSESLRGIRDISGVRVGDVLIAANWEPSNMHVDTKPIESEQYAKRPEKKPSMNTEFSTYLPAMSISFGEFHPLDPRSLTSLIL